MLAALRRTYINAICPGWSNRRQWDFFHKLFRSGAIREVAIMGVYMGRDIGYMAAAFKAAGIADFHITGVDRFANVPGEDWPEADRAKTWRQMGFGDAPSLERTSRNIRRLGLAGQVDLLRGEAAEILKAQRRFDFVYIDISHDYASTRMAIGLAKQVVKPEGVVGGDDFSDEGTWGVATAVREACGNFEVADNWIWSARAADVASR